MIRKLLRSPAAVVALGGTAFAGDLPSRAAPPVYVPPPPTLTWTGAYIGGQVGYQWGTTNAPGYDPAPAAPAPPPDPSIKSSGVVGGAHAGYNYQVSQFVAGLEGDIEGSSRHGSYNDGILATWLRMPVEGSLRGRVGLAWDRALFYGTGGAAFGSLHTTVTNLASGAFDTFDDFRVGWTAGGGVEYAVDNNWSVRAEYRYTDFGRFTDVLTNSAGGVLLRRHDTDNAVRVGFSYTFGAPPPPAPVIAKY